MKNDYISRKAIRSFIGRRISWLEERMSSASNEGRWVEEEKYQCAIENLELINEHIKTEQEPKTGHWTERKKHEITGFFLPTCSECGNIQPYTHHTFRWNYCPNCGARMEDE